MKVDKSKLISMYKDAQTASETKKAVIYNEFIDYCDLCEVNFATALAFAGRMSTTPNK